MVTHESTGVHGRGTEEVKTNDVSQRIKQGEVGLVVEFGRPGIGVYFHEVQKATRAMAAEGVVFEQGNPVTQMMTDTANGTSGKTCWAKKSSPASSSLPYRSMTVRVLGVIKRYRHARYGGQHRGFHRLRPGRERTAQGQLLAR